ncbi:hypothetical protein GLX27_001254 [Malassezia furfur]|uniref:RING-type E3 ubiquitin transferase n=1 Tax=Malassezia furfur TaxID=55194 RepID=A0ABY8EM34_MALFU|nr:hypothetical protein CBS14141_001081 [Malassezia furfur]WFD46617.1 hypothetical protein GLX27_001254 [Malassezia furfur]
MSEVGGSARDATSTGDRGDTQREDNEDAHRHASPGTGSPGTGSADEMARHAPAPADDVATSAAHTPSESTLRARIVSALSFLADDAAEDDTSVHSWSTPPPDAYASDLSSGSSGASGTARHVARSVGRWEDDHDVRACRKCGRTFTFFVRKHHCRRCGRIFCDACTTHRAHLRVDDLIIDPTMPEMLDVERVGPSRVCDWCVETYHLAPEPRDGAHDTSLLTHMISYMQRPRPADAARDGDGEASLASSLLDECPVCYRPLRTLPTEEAREAHVMHCLEHGAPADVVPRTRYVVSQLAPDSVLIGNECIICMEEFAVRDVVARLGCLCCFHRACIDAWLRKSTGCPTHARPPS